jgi:beta-galactosidase
MYIDFDGIQTKSQIWLNGHFLGSWDYGYTGSRYYVNSTVLNMAGDNVLVARVDCTEPDGWWYDGGGIYRNVWFTAIESPGPVIAPWGLYVGGSKPTGAITWDAAGNPSADAELLPMVEVFNNVSSTASVDFSLAVTVMDASGKKVGSTTGSGSVAGGGGSVNWAPKTAMAMPAASLWHVVSPPNKPALYTATAELTVGGKVVDSVTETFGVRKTNWTGSNGFFLNDKPFKILGNANHQDFAAVGVAVPDHLQWYRVQGQKNWGSNGWRTAHNPPTPALLDACDELGYVMWDENHRNGQLDQVPWLIKRDRNHPSVVIWSICNEVLCNSKDSVNDAIAMKQLMHQLDPLGNRPVSANQNGWVGPHTPLDVQGFDYSTQNYDKWHAAAPEIPSISSETSSAVSDRGEYANNPTTGHVTGYDTDYPGWGQSAEMAWGGINEKNGDGILTKPFISGGWTWTGWDYRGEPTPYAWPNVNSHFGIMDLTGFWKDRTHWYASWFPNFNEEAKPVTHVHAFPHWDWKDGDTVDIWSFSNADSVELVVNGKTVSKQQMVEYGHVTWKGVPFAAGSYTVTGYDKSGAAVGSKTVTTSSKPAALKASIKDGVGATLYAGCQDMALVQVEVLDAKGNVVSDPDNTDGTNVTFAVSGSATGAWVEGTGNGDPSCLVNNKSPMRPAYHGLALGVIGSGNVAGTITVTVTSPGLTSSSVAIQVKAQDPTADDFNPKWCIQEPKW